jgi:hypothetical protein
MLKLLKSKELVWFLAGVAVGGWAVVITYDIANKRTKPPAEEEPAE